MRVHCVVTNPLVVPESLYCEDLDPLAVSEHNVLFFFQCGLHHNGWSYWLL